VDEETFRAAKERREERQPEKTNPSPANSPTLLTGLLKCGVCGAGMTLATGYGGRYRYYKCTNRINKGNEACSSGNIPMERLDELIIKAISEKVFTPERVAAMLKELQERLNKSRSKHDEHLETLKKELDELKNRMDRLCDAIEKRYSSERCCPGTLPENPGQASGCPCGDDRTKKTAGISSQ
jgi:site-specific DNA recombinase